MSARLIFRPQLLLLLVLGYPLLYLVPLVAEDVGHVLENIVLIPLFGLVVLLAVAQGRFSMRRKDVTVYLLFFVLILLAFWHTGEARYSKPIFVLSTLFVTYHLISGMKRPATDAIVIYLFIIYLLASSAALLMPSRFNDFGRFLGFALSPTVFSVFLEAILVAFCYTKTDWRWKILAYVVVFGFVVLTNTRLNLLFLIGFPFLALTIKLFPSSKGILQVFIVFGLIMLYPAYAWFNQTTGEFVTVGRYEDSMEDTSFSLRLALSGTLSANLVEGGADGVLLGGGAGAARKQVIESFNEDLLPHNDFLLLTTDFGLVFLLIYLTLLYFVAARSACSFVLMNLYLIAFYHNMIYSYYLLFLIVYFSLDSDRNSATHDNGEPYPGRESNVV